MPFISCNFAHRSILRLGGPDRRAFLQGLVSNDVDLVTAERVIYATLLTPQGKFLHDLFIAESGDEFLIDCEAARAEDLLKRLTAYKLRAKITIDNAAADFDIWAIWDTDTGTDATPRFTGDRFIAYADPRLPELGLRVIVKKGSSPENTVPFTEYDHHRLALGVPDGSRDMIIEKSTLTDGNIDLLNGISWSKGCYVGQELTARMHYRALVKKRMFPVRVEGATSAFGTAVMLDGEDIGDMRSSAGDLGLALLNIDKAEKALAQNLPLSCSGSLLTVQKPEWMTAPENGGGV